MRFLDNSHSTLCFKNNFRIWVTEQRTQKTNISEERNFSRIVMHLTLGKDNFPEVETAFLG